MLPGNLNITIYRNTDWICTLTCKDSTGEPVDLTGYTPYAEARASKDRTSRAFDLNPVIAADQSANKGKVTLTRLHANKAEMRAGTYYWDLLFDTLGGNRFGPYVGGTCTVEQTYTRP